MTEYTEINNKIEFDKLITYTYDKSLKNLEFSHYKFLFPINISETLNSVSFNNCIFTEDVQFSSTFNLDATFRQTIFEKIADFSNCHFKGKTRFHTIEFKETANFHNTKFDDLSDFWGSKFFQPIIFYKTDFLGITVFSRTEFKENVLFTYSLINKIIIFRGTIFNKGLDLSLTILNGNFNVFDIRLDNFNSEDQNYNEDDYDDFVPESAVIPEKNKRETFRLIKKQLQNQGNQIDSLIYSNLEIKTYYKQLKRQVFKEFKIKNRIQNYIILELNYLSNKNGKSWFRAIVFTFTIGFLFFYLSIISTNNYSIGWDNISWDNFNECIKLYFTFMTPTHKVEYLDYLGSTSLTYVSDFIGRTFIAYGIYQTIQAFRKFKGN